MTATKTLLPVLALGILVACAHQHGISASDPVKEVTDVLQRSVAAYERGDFAGVEATWAHGEEASVYESGEANYGWTDYRDHHLKPELAEMKNVQYRLDDIVVRGDATTAWSTFKWTFSADFKGRRVNASGLGTAAIEKREDGWKIVHWHTSTSH